MNIKKMVAEIISACNALETEKAELLSRVQVIDDRLTAYHMAIDSLNLAGPADEQKPIAKDAKPVEAHARIGRRTVLTLNEKSQTLAQWAKDLRMSPDGIMYRLNHGWSVADALSKDKMCYKVPQKPQKVFAYDKLGNVIRQYVGVGDASRDLNMPVSTIEKIIAKMSKDDQLRVRDYYLAYVG